MSNFSKYIFAPWVRQGLSNHIAEIDNAGGVEGTVLGRAEMSAVLNWTGGNVSKTIKIVGPGDVTSISDSAILKMSPSSGSSKMEENYLPFIEFYEEDFPWRYTPSAPTPNVDNTNKSKLTPWLALVVLKSSGASAEFDFELQPEGLPILKIKPSVNITDVFHPHTEHWAWAHVQYNVKDSESSLKNFDNTDASTSLLGTLKSGIKSDPDRALSRILCPRNLDVDTNYRAFLIPAFETGRLAGLGEDYSGIKAQQSSWDPGNTTRVKEFPVYKEWNFKTASDGDFETLAKRLRPRAFQGTGGRNLYITDSGYGVKYVDNTSAYVDRNLKLEGALRDPNPAAANDSWPSSGSQHSKDDAYIAKLSKMVNLGREMETVNASATNPNIPPHPFSTSPINEDPIVSPPMYGQWHFIKSQLPHTMPTIGTDLWLSQVNLNPAWRVAAGVGTQIIRENQEEFMERAWGQVGEINEANEVIRISELLKWTQKQLEERHFRNAPLNRYIRMNSSLMSRISNGAGQSLLGELKESAMSTATIDNGFRKMVRPQSIVVKKASRTANVAAASFVEDMIAESDGVSTATNNYRAAADFSIASGLVNNFPSNVGIMALATTLSSYTVPVANSFDLEGARTEISRRTDAFTQTSRNHGYSHAPLDSNGLPYSLIDRKMVCKFRRMDENFTWSPIENRKPIMAYPKFEDSIGDILKKIDVEYILPEISNVKNNSVTLLETNPKFIESLMLGLNHEMSRELLWREFPTDQRGSYFRTFWDKSDAIDITSPEDIKEVHSWEGTLGGNTTTTPSGSSNMVLFVKGDLLKKYPDATIYAQKADKPSVANGCAESNGSGGHKRVKESGEIVPLPMLSGEENRKHPIFHLRIEPDITIIGFDITKSEALGQFEDTYDNNDIDLTADAGYYFVFAERPGKPKFGLDSGTTATSGADLNSWNDYNWGDISNANFISPTASVTEPSTIDEVKWGASSAEMAYITFQKPALVAIHAEKMLKDV